MSYKDLKNFQQILNKSEFNYISDLSNIMAVSDVIKNKIRNPDGNELVYLETVGKFLRNLGSFYDAVGGEGIPDLKKGHKTCEQELSRSISFLRSSPEKRRSIGKSYIRKLNKSFLYG